VLGLFIDIETSGLDPTKHRVLEIALKAYDFKKNALVGQYEAIVNQSEEVWNRADPSSLKVNGFTEELKNTGKEEKQVKEEILEFLKPFNFSRKHAVFIAQNSSFDRAFFAQLFPPYEQEKLQWPYNWLDLASMYWAISAIQSPNFPEGVNLSKNHIATIYGLPEEEHPHRAMNGVKHLILCYEAILNSKHQS
jgi:oligoribonuclease